MVLIFFTFGIKIAYIYLYLSIDITIFFGIFKMFCLFSIGIINWYHDISMYTFMLNWYIFQLGIIMLWFVLFICKENLTSSLYINSYWVYFILRRLTSLLYVLHVCSRSYTFLFIHCILCFMWFSHLFSCIACMQGELTLRLSSVGTCFWWYICEDISMELYLTSLFKSSTWSRLPKESRYGCVL